MNRKLSNHIVSKLFFITRRNQDRTEHFWTGARPILQTLDLKTNILDLKFYLHSEWFFLRMTYVFFGIALVAVGV